MSKCLKEFADKIPRTMIPWLVFNAALVPLMTISLMAWNGIARKLDNSSLQALLTIGASTSIPISGATTLAMACAIALTPKDKTLQSAELILGLALLLSHKGIELDLQWRFLQSAKYLHENNLSLGDQAECLEKIQQLSLMGVDVKALLSVSGEGND